MFSLRPVRGQPNADCLLSLRRRTGFKPASFDEGGVCCFLIRFIVHGALCADYNLPGLELLYARSLSDVKSL